MKQIQLCTAALMLCLCHTGAAVCQDTFPAPAARFAIVIGKNEPEQADQATLQYADDDAFLMHQLLTEAGAKSTLLLHPDGDTGTLHQLGATTRPTLAALRTAFARVSNEIKKERERGRKTELIFFYSGHGDVADGEGFVVLENGRLTRTMLMNEIIAKSPAHTNHIIIDACKSYLMAFNKGPGGTRRPFHQAFDVSASRKNMDRTGFVLSASSAQDSHEWERFQAGIFSYEVRSALRGGADANQDGRITYGELGGFITTANAGIVNPRFRPQFFVRPPGGKPDYARPLLNWRRQKGRLEVDAKSSGHYFIETTTGVRIADVHPDGDQSLTVYLPESRPLFVRNASETKEGILHHDRPVLLSALEMKPAHITRKGALNLAFESIFLAPFSSAAVSAYESNEKRISREGGAVEDSGTRIPRDRLNNSDTLRNTLLGATVVSLAAGGTLSMVAYSRLRKAEGRNQQKIFEINQSIDSLNTTAAVCYGVAAAAGISWLALTVMNVRNQKKGLSLSPTLDLRGQLAGMIFVRTF
ncbi:MAG: caspase family protein [Deltaproteobacteria bacterium]|nr:caspase family protein [Deltaproteobacteria bacterium]